MPNALYAKGKEGLIDGSIDLDTDTIKVVLVNTGSYTVDLALHDFLDDIPVGARVGTAVALTSRTVTAGAFDAADIASYATTAGTLVSALVIYKEPASPTDATSRLIAYIDTANGLPFTTTTSVAIAWDNGADRILHLV